MPKNRTSMEEYLMTNDGARSMRELADTGEQIGIDLLVQTVTDWQGEVKERATLMTENREVFGTFSSSFIRGAKSFLAVLEKEDYKPFRFVVDTAPTKRGQPCLILRVIDFYEEV